MIVEVLIFWSVLLGVALNMSYEAENEEDEPVAESIV